VCHVFVWCWMWAAPGPRRSTPGGCLRPKCVHSICHCCCRASGGRSWRATTDCTACLLNSPLPHVTVLQGERRPRLEGDEYYGVIDELCKAIKALWPHALLQVGAVDRAVQWARAHLGRSLEMGGWMPVRCTSAAQHLLQQPLC